MAVHLGNEQSAFASSNSSRSSFGFAIWPPAAVAISEKVGETDESSVKARVESLCRLALSNGTRHSLAHTRVHLAHL